MLKLYDCILLNFSLTFQTHSFGTFRGKQQAVLKLTYHQPEEISKRLPILRNQLTQRKVSIHLRSLQAT